MVTDPLAQVAPTPAPAAAPPVVATGRNGVRYPERAALDADYLAGWSLWQDMVIMLKTIPAVLSRHGSD